MSKKHICYYSNSEKDKLSAPFLEELKKTPWIRDFEFICVDPSPNRPPLPRFLKQAPTIIVSDDKENPVKEGMEVMNWLYTRKMLEQANNPPPKPSSATDPNVSGQVNSWVPGEMSGFGDAGYSYLDSDTSTGGDGGKSIPGNFTFYGQSGPGDRQTQQFGQQYAPQQSQLGRSKKELMMDQQLDLFKQQRDMDLPRGPKRM